MRLLHILIVTSAPVAPTTLVRLVTGTSGSMQQPPPLVPADALRDLQHVLRYSLNEAISNALVPDNATFNCGTANALESLLALGTFHVAQVPCRFVRVVVGDAGLATPAPINNASTIPVGRRAPSSVKRKSSDGSGERATPAAKKVKPVQRRTTAQPTQRREKIVDPLLCACRSPHKHTIWSGARNVDDFWN